MKITKAGSFWLVYIFGFALLCGSLQGCFLTTPQPQISTTPSGQTVTNTVYAVNTNALNQVAQTVNGVATVATPFVPPPYNALVTPLAESVGWLLGIVASITAAIQTKKATAGKSVVTAIETLPLALAPTVKEHIATVTQAMGTAATVDSLVQSVTR